jgi:hypothetical protein
MRSKSFKAGKRKMALRKERRKILRKKTRG